MQRPTWKYMVLGLRGNWIHVATEHCASQEQAEREFRYNFPAYFAMDRVWKIVSAETEV